MLIESKRMRARGESPRWEVPGSPSSDRRRRWARCIRTCLASGAFLLFAALAAMPARAGTLNVPAEYATIQSAVDAAANGDVVLVAPGTYLERVVISGKGLTIASHFYVTGDPSFIDQTVIDAFGRLSETSWEPGSNAIYVDRTLPSEVNIIGLTVTNANNGVEVYSPTNILYSKITGAFDAIDLRSTALVRGCTIYGNGDEAVDFNTPSWGVVEYNSLFDNDGDGIEIRITGSSDLSAELHHIHHNTITGNNNDGVQIIALDEIGPPNRQLIIEDNLIAGNGNAGVGLMCCGVSTENLEGAAIQSRVLVRGNTFRDNGHGVTGGDDMIVLNNIFAGHDVGVKRLLVDSIAAHNLFFANVTDFLNANVDLATTLVATDPLFAPDSSLLPGSPAIDAGTSQFSWNGELVLDLAPGDYVGPAPDLGAFESGGSTPLNRPPFVRAGEDQELPLGSVMNLAGVASDDGLPGGPLAIEWREVSGTGNVSFSDANAAVGTASFAVGGIYELELEADDGELASTDRVEVRVGITSLDVRVGDGADDAEEALADGNVSLSSSDLEMSFDSSLGDDQIVGLRFAAVDIPPGMEIIDAYVQFRADEVNADPTSLMVEGEAATDAAAFVDSPGNLSLRPRTPTAVAWSPAAWPNAGEAGADQRTPDLSVIIEEITGQPGWTQNGPLVLFVSGSGKRVADSFEGSPTAAPLLHVDYRSPAPAGDAPSVSAGPDVSIELPEDAVLDGSVSDDGLPNPPGVTTAMWSQTDGPGTATFTPPDAEDTTVSFSQAGTYVLTLTGDDSEQQASDDVTVFVPEPVALGQLGSGIGLLALLARRRARRCLR
jgi:hypothetical protein